MKKSPLISLVIILIIAVFAGCQSNQPESSEPETASAETTVADITSGSGISNRVSGNTPLEKIKAYVSQFKDGDGKPYYDLSFIKETDCIPEENSKQVFSRMGLEIYRLNLTDEQFDSISFPKDDLSTFAVGENGVIPLSRISFLFGYDSDVNDIPVCDIDGDGDDELISFWASLASGDPYASFVNMYIAGQKDGVPFSEAYYQIKDSEDIKIAEAFQTAGKIYVDEESQAIIVKGDSDVYQLKVKDGEAQCSKIE